MFHEWFSQQTWEQIAFWSQVAIWTIGCIGLMLAILAYAAKQNASLLKEQQEIIAKGPRTLSTSQREQLIAAARRNPIKITLIRLDDIEAAPYADQIADALLAGGATIRHMNIGFMGQVIGLEIRPEGLDPQPLQVILKAANLTATISNSPIPIPMSIKAQYAGHIGFIVGLKPPR